MRSINKSSFDYTDILVVARELEYTISNLDFESLPLHESVKSYYRFDLNKIKYVSECNAFLLFQILKKSAKPIDKVCIIDHGAGLGLFSFLVKKMGAQCISHDISTDYLEGIKTIGGAIQLIPDHFVEGDTEELINFCQSHSIKPDALASRNVIEHIPDYSNFFKNLNALSQNGFVALISTSANIHNPLVKNIHLKIHNQYETLGSNMDMDNPSLNTENCGIKLRSEIIRKQYPELDPETILLLAINNRGFVKTQIIKRVKAYLDSGILPSVFKEPSNTCDPITGAWVERLVPFQEYKQAAEENSFHFELLTGFYNTHYTSKLKNIVSYVLNSILKIRNPWQVNLSPFLVFKLKKL